MDYLINVNQGKAYEFNREVGEFKQEHTVIQNKLDRLMDFLVDGSFTIVMPIGLGDKEHNYCKLSFPRRRESRYLLSQV